MMKLPVDGLASEVISLKFPNFPHLTGRVIDCIYVFADASTKAYSAVIYLHSNNNISFVMSKSRVAPIKALTFPRLELMAAVTANKVAKFVILRRRRNCRECLIQKLLRKP